MSAKQRPGLMPARTEKRSVATIAKDSAITPEIAAPRDASVGPALVLVRTRPADGTATAGLPLTREVATAETGRQLDGTAGTAASANTEGTIVGPGRDQGRPLAGPGTRGPPADRKSSPVVSRV